MFGFNPVSRISPDKFYIFLNIFIEDMFLQIFYDLHNVFPQQPDRLGYGEIV